MSIIKLSFLFSLLFIASCTHIDAINDKPITNRFSADPSPHYFNNKVYVYATDDQSNSGKYWDSTSWRLYSSKNLSEWIDEGSFLDVSVFKWAKPDAKAWAPEAAYRNGKYYFYAPVGGDKIGVAVSNNPKKGFYDSLGKPLIDKALDKNAGAEPIDPMVFIDDDGQAYLSFGTRIPKIVKLNSDMISLNGEIKDIRINDFPKEDPKKKYGEAPFINKYNGKYYFSFSTGWPGQIVYGISDNPMGPYQYQGVVFDYLNISTNHQAIIKIRNKNYFFYHDNLLNGGGSFKRSIAIKELFYDENGKIIEIKK